MTAVDLNGLNAGYVAQMLEAYLDAPSSVPVEWRELFEREPDAFRRSLPGLDGLLGAGSRGNGAPTPAVDVAAPPDAARPPQARCDGAAGTPRAC